MCCSLTYNSSSSYVASFYHSVKYMPVRLALGHVIPSEIYDMYLTTEVAVFVRYGNVGGGVDHVRNLTLRPAGNSFQ